MLFAAEVQVGLGQRDAGHGAQFGVDLQQQFDVLLDGGGERINLEGRSPLGGHRLFRSQLNVVQFYSRRRFGDFNRARGGSFDGSAAQIVRGSKTPGTVGDDTHSETKRLCHRGAADFAILGGEPAVTIVGQANVGIGCPEVIGNIEGPVGNGFHGKFNLTQCHRPGLMRRLCRTPRFLYQMSVLRSQFSGWNTRKGTADAAPGTGDRRPYSSPLTPPCQILFLLWSEFVDLDSD